MKRNYHRWTNAEVKVIIGLYEDGVPHKEIAEAVGLPVNVVSKKIYNLKKQGLIDKEIKRLFVWTPEIEKDFLNILQKNIGNLQQGFRTFAEKYNCSITVPSNKYYNSKILGGRIKDRCKVFGQFGRYRGIANSKIYKREDSKGYNFWSVIKKFFN